jgi:radical SAM superfamily enzyme YgiQ (UPF0313 family)
MDCVFLHVPKKVGPYLEILKMPLGLTALARLLEQNGISTKIFHLTIEELLNRKFILPKAEFYCLPLHWHPQSFRVIETARAIKKNEPDCKIILGGFTASLFAGEIMSSFKEIDFIIKGDAEVPLLELIKMTTPLESIPNLVWRKGEEVIENRQSFTIDQNLLDGLEYSHLELINNYDIYLRIYDYENAIEQTPIEKLKKGRAFFYYNAGRGCPVNCSFCGGSNLSQCLLNNRKQHLFKSSESVVRDLINLKNFRVDHLYTSFDPDPKGKYYLDLFEKIMANKLAYNLYFECWDLPAKAFIDSFASTFGSDSYLILSPDSGSEKVRRLNKGYFYTNRELMDVLDYIHQKKVKGELYFSVGFPFEEKGDIEETLKLLIAVKKKYGQHFKLSIMPIELDPGSPLWLDPGKYQVTTFRKNFKDLYLAHQKTPTLGYRTESFSDEEILRNYRMMLNKLTAA